MLFVGIDPGERWCGLATLEIERNRYARTNAAVYDLTDNVLGELVHKITNIAHHNGHIRYVIEDFQVRPVGHQSFTRGNTLRFIGALEYALYLRDITPRYIKPGKPEEALRILPILQTWNTGETRGDTRWKHALSAWRVLGLHLLTTLPLVVDRLRNATLERTDACSPEWSNDFFADTLGWCLPKGPK